MKKNYDFLTEEERRTAINQIIIFFAEERGEEIGVIAAGNFLDFALEYIGIPAYNRGLEEGKDWMKERLAGLEIDFEELKK